jgi:hypothetical protein
VKDKSAQKCERLRISHLWFWETLINRQTKSYGRGIDILELRFPVLSKADEYMIIQAAHPAGRLNYHLSWQNKSIV